MHISWNIIEYVHIYANKNNITPHYANSCLELGFHNMDQYTRETKRHQSVAESETPLLQNVNLIQVDL